MQRDGRHPRSQRGAWAPILFQLAFLLKSVMYIYVTELFRSERFLFYMIRARRIYENVETEWHTFKSAGK